MRIDTKKRLLFTSKTYSLQKQKKRYKKHIDVDKKQKKRPIWSVFLMFS